MNPKDPDPTSYQDYIREEVRKARLERDLAVAQLIVDAVQSLVRYAARIPRRKLAQDHTY